MATAIVRITALAIFGLLPICVVAEVPTADVLVVYSNGRLLPANVDVDRGLEEGQSNSIHARVEFFSEFLGVPTFAGPTYEAHAASYFKEKYATRRPQVIVVAGAPALDFVLRHRDEMFARVPVVHVGVDRRWLASRTLPDDVVGVPADYDLMGTIELALQLQPNAKRLVVVTGSSAWDRAREAEVRAGLGALHLNHPVEFLAGLPTADVTRLLAALPSDAVVFTPGYFRDGAGRDFAPRDSVVAMVDASSAAIYAPYATQLGTGIVGGRMSSYVDMGRATRTIIDDIIAHSSLSKMKIPGEIPAVVQLDWRQLRKWNIDANRIPSDAVLMFRTPTFWEAYRVPAIIGALVIFLQATLIAALLFEHRRRRRTATALAESEEQIRLAAQAARLSLWSWELNDANQVAGTPHESAERLRQPPGGFDEVLRSVHPADRDRFHHAVKGAADGNSELDIEYRVRLPDGHIRWLAARGHATGVDPCCLIGVSMDISERKAAERQAESDRVTLAHMSRVSMMGQLSAAVAHQLNQPLAAILGNAETARKMLNRGSVDGFEMGEILDDIIGENHRAAEIIRRLGALYKRNATDASSFDLNNLVRETLDLVQSELTSRVITVATNLDETLPLVEAGRVQIQQVILNLVLNAADAMQDQDADRREMIVQTSSECGKAELCVIDRGTGIAADDLAQIFDPFWTTKAHGVGIGLAICQAIITAHRGKLTAANNPPGGASLCFALPLQAAR